MKLGRYYHKWRQQNKQGGGEPSLTEGGEIPVLLLPGGGVDSEYVVVAREGVLAPDGGGCVIIQHAQRGVEGMPVAHERRLA